MTFNNDEEDDAENLVLVGNLDQEPVNIDSRGVRKCTCGLAGGCQGLLLQICLAFVSGSDFDGLSKHP